MTHGSLFSGIGGFDLASEWMGWTNVFNCDIEEFPRQVLKYHFPNAIQYDDIKQTDFTAHAGQIDVLTGGFPCQPYSHAGKRLGKEDDRHLWPEMLRAVREIRPRWIVGENVRGLLSWNDGLVFEEVHTDLEAEGYEVQAFILPAAGVNAPHRRERIWFIAHTNSNCKSELSEHDTKRCRELGESSSNTNGIRYRGGASEGCSKRQQGKLLQNQQERREVDCEAQRYSGEQFYSDTLCKRLQGNKFNETSAGKERKQKNSRYTASQLYQTQNWEQFPTQSPICGGDDGLPRELDAISFSKWRIESIKGYGNAIVPQVAYRLLQSIQLTEEHND